MANLLQNQMPSWTSRESGSRFRVMVTRKVDVLLVLTNRQGENPRGGFLITPFMRWPLKPKIRAHDYSQRDRKEFTRMYCPKLSQLLEWNQDAICESNIRVVCEAFHPGLYLITRFTSFQKTPTSMKDVERTTRETSPKHERQQNVDHDLKKKN